MLVDTSSLFQYINTLPEAGVYAICNEAEKTVYINHTTKFKTKLGEIAYKMKLNCNLQVFYISPHPIYKLLMAEKIRKDFLNRGYKVLNQEVPYINFRVNSSIDSEGRYALVYITSSRGYKQIVGVFKNVKEADLFRDDFYGENWSGLDIVYSCNVHTRKYVVTHGYKHSKLGDKQYLIESNDSEAANDSEE